MATTFSDVTDLQQCHHALNILHLVEKVKSFPLKAKSKKKGEEVHQPQPLPPAPFFHGKGMTLRVRPRVKPAYNSEWREMWYGLVDN